MKPRLERLVMSPNLLQQIECRLGNGHLAPSALSHLSIYEHIYHVLMIALP